MEKEEYWENFFASGKVADYLNYCRASERRQEEESPEDEVADKVKHNAGFY